MEQLLKSAKIKHYIETNQIKKAQLGIAEKNQSCSIITAGNFPKSRYIINQRNFQEHQFLF